MFACFDKSFSELAKWSQSSHSLNQILTVNPSSES